MNKKTRNNTLILLSKIDISCKQIKTHNQLNYI